MSNFKLELRQNYRGNFEFTEQELKDLILKSYNNGYQDCKEKIQSFFSNIQNPNICCIEELYRQQASINILDFINTIL